MEIHQLKYFVQAARSSSFNEAAQALFISRQALSRSIASLEAELGYDLFDRLARGTQLTAKGRMFLEASLPVVRAFEELEQLTESGRYIPTVSVAIPITWTDFFESSIRRFAASRPDVRVTISSWTDQECLRRAKTGDSDVVVSHIPIDGTLDEGVTLVRTPLVIVMNRACPLADRESVNSADLAGYNISYYTCGYGKLTWAPSINGRTEEFDNDIAHIYARLHRNESVFPAPLATMATHLDDLVCVAFDGPFNTVTMSGYISSAVKDRPLLQQACQDLRDAMRFEV